MTRKYVNPGNEGFWEVRSGEYVDKTGLIALVNAVIGKPRSPVCSTRPRRFGKTFAAESLVAYYSCGCDSRGLFEGLAITRDPSFEEHLNAYNVVRLDMAALKGHKDVVKVVEARLLADLERELPGATFRAESIGLALGDFVDATGRKFVFVIDEWDAPLRERGSKKTKEGWVDFLRLLFKNMTSTSKAIAACYMTGILPIVRLGTQSSLGDFREYTFLRPGPYAPYVGFSEAEVEGLAERHNMNMAELKRWYDGYEILG